MGPTPYVTAYVFVYELEGMIMAYFLYIWSLPLHRRYLLWIFALQRSKWERLLAGNEILLFFITFESVIFGLIHVVMFNIAVQKISMENANKIPWVKKYLVCLINVVFTYEKDINKILYYLKIMKYFAYTNVIVTYQIIEVQIKNLRMR